MSEELNMLHLAYMVGWEDGFARRKAEQSQVDKLAQGTCRMERMPECQFNDIECSECGVALWAFDMDISGEGILTKPRYCPNCGRRVEVDA